MTLPPAIFSPPNSFTPRRWPAESRPLREEPPAFLCAMDLFLAGRDRQHLQLGEVLAMAALAMGVLAALFLESDDFFALAMFDDFAGHRGAFDQRRAQLGAVTAEQQDFTQGQLGADIAGQAFHRQDGVLGHFVLLTAGADDRIHGLIP